MVTLNYTDNHVGQLDFHWVDILYSFCVSSIFILEVNAGNNSLQSLMEHTWTSFIISVLDDRIPLATTVSLVIVSLASVYREIYS